VSARSSASLAGVLIVCALGFAAPHAWAAGAWPNSAKNAPSSERVALQEVASRLRKTSASPLALADCLRVINAFDALAPAAIAEILQPVARRWLKTGAAIALPAGTTLRAILREATRRSAGITGQAAWLDRRGEVTRWSWLGPFDAAHGSAFDRVDPIEEEVGAALSYAGRDTAVRWQAVPTALVQDVTGLRLESLVERPAEAIIYARSYVRLASRTSVRLRLATAGSARLLVDGKRVLEVRRPGALGPAPLLLPLAEVEVLLAAGWHQVRIKLSSGQGQAWLGLEILDSKGKPLVLAQRFDPPPSTSPGAASPAPPVVQAADSDWRHALVQRAAGPAKGRKAQDRDRALAGLALARSAGWTLPEGTSGAVDKSLKAHPSPAMGLLAAMSGEAGDRVARLRASLTAHPEHVGLRLALAAGLDEMGKSAEAQQVWLGASKVSALERGSIRGCALRTDLWLRLGADLAALNVARGCLKRWPDSPLAVGLAARLARARDDLAGAVTLQGRLAALEASRPSRRSQEVAALIQAGELARARATAERVAKQLPGLTRVAEMMAGAAANGRDPAAARTWLDRIPPWRWRSSTWELSARVAATAGDRERAIHDLRTALRRAPARSELRARLRLLEPAGDFFQRHRRDLVAMARARKGKPVAAPLARRFRHTVIRVLGGGRQARYEAEAVVIGKGGPSEHEVEIPYVPSQSSVQILRAEIVRRNGRIDRRVRQDLEQLSEGWSGLYYDLEQIKLRFERLQPGDVVVVEAVTRDFVGDPFGFVFGELLPLVGHRPILETEIVVELPAGTPLHHVIWDPGSGKSRPETLRRVIKAGSGGQSAGRWDVWRLRLGELPAVPAEEDMPGATSVVPYLHMSSFASWTAAASWYAGLLRQSLPARGTEPGLTRLARKLTAGQVDLPGRVNAVYRHVADRVRYVGLEFGIHSLQPHAPALVLQRGFGDCKDKATLIVALLRELGISAEVVLVRTADNGRLGDGVASLGVFDHAIAYVPALGWWLDATLQGHAPTELPEGDAGGVALRVPEAVTRSTAEPLPMAKAGRNLRREIVQMTLRPNGDARMHLELRFTGLPAADVRGRLHAPATRQERLEEDLTARFAGLSIEQLSVQGVDPVLPEVVVKVRGIVPGWARATRAGLQIQPLRRRVPLVRALAATPTRSHALVSRWPGRSVQRLRIVAPAGMVIQQAPMPMKAPSPLGHFELVVHKPAPNIVELKKDFERARWQVAAADYAAWRAWLGRIDGALGGLVKVGAAAGGPP